MMKICIAWENDLPIIKKTICEVEELGLVDDVPEGRCISAANKVANYCKVTRPNMQRVCINN